MLGRTQARSPSTTALNGRIATTPATGGTDTHAHRAAYDLRAFWSFPVTVRVIARILA